MADMKLKNLKIDYLEGIIEGKMADYGKHCNSIPEEINLHYSFVFTNKVGLIGQENHPSNSVKITFSWIADGKWVMVDEETNSHEYRGEKADDSFTIQAGESIIRLQMEVEQILDRITEIK